MTTSDAILNGQLCLRSDCDSQEHMILSLIAKDGACSGDEYGWFALCLSYTGCWVEGAGDG